MQRKKERQKENAWKDIGRKNKRRGMKERKRERKSIERKKE